MKVVFAHYGREHLGIQYLSSVLKNNGCSVELVCDTGLFSREDNVFYMNYLNKVFYNQNVIKEIIETDPDLIAFSPYTTTYQWASHIAEEVKKYINVPIVFGGIHATLVPEDVIKNDFVDFVLIGESDYAILELVESLNKKNLLEKIKNLCFKKDRKIVRNEIRPPIENLDSLPFPDKELFKKYIRFKDDYMIMTSRGCILNCTYCCESYLNKVYKGHYYRRRSANNVIDELKIMKARYDFKEVMFFDSIFFTDGRWLQEFLPMYKQEISVPFRCTGHVTYFNSQIARIMKESGCYCIDFGVQTFNQNIRRNILHRFETNEQIKEAFNICDKFKLRYDVDLMIGIPGARIDDYLQTVNFMMSFKYLNRLKCYYLSYFPCTNIIEKAEKMGILNDKHIEHINAGKIGDWFHVNYNKDTKTSDVFTKIYKIYPLIPKYIRRKIVEKNYYKYFYKVPKSLIVLLQLLIGLKNRDYRFAIYINNYFHNFIKKFKSLFKTTKYVNDVYKVKL